MAQQMLHDALIMSAQQAADRLGVDKSTITRWVKSGHLRTMGRAGNSTLSQLVFLEDDVERLAAVRRGDVGDVTAAAADPTDDVRAYRRAAWLAAIETVTKRTGGTFYTGQLRAFLPEDARGKQPGGLITGLVRGKRIEHTGGYGTLDDSRARHSSTPCKVYRVIGVLA